MKDGEWEAYGRKKGWIVAKDIGGPDKKKLKEKLEDPVENTCNNCHKVMIDDEMSETGHVCGYCSSNKI